MAAALTLDDATGSSKVPAGSFTSPIGLSGLTTPLVAAQPCTIRPSGVTSVPLLSNENAPARVYVVSLPERTTKNPSPWIIRSVERPVFCADPWLKFVMIPPSWAPSTLRSELVV